MRKIGETYYYVYADMERGKPTALGYATSQSPMGPFSYQGIIIDNDGCDPASWNNHGSIACMNGQWYVFYHRCSQGMQQHRRLCIEKIHINEDGTINEVKMTSQGIGDPFAPGEKIMGYRACGVKGSCYIGLDETCGEKLMHIADGDGAVFRYVRSDGEWNAISLTVNGSGTVRVLMNKKEAGTVHIAESHTCQTVQAPIHMPSGEYELELIFEQPQNLEILDLTLS